MSRRWTHTEIDVATTRGHVKVRAEVSSAGPGLAIHRCINRLFDGKTVTHVASGRAIVQGVPTEHAPNILITLAKLGDWTRTIEEINGDRELADQVRAVLSKSWYACAMHSKVLQ